MTSLAFHGTNSATKTLVDILILQGLRVALTNTLPTVAQTVFDPGGAHPPPANGSIHGYPTNGALLTGVVSATTNTTDAAGSAAKVTFVASGGSFGPFQYVLYFLDNITGDPLMGWVDLGAPVTLTDGQSFTTRFSGVDGVGTVVTVAAG